MRDNNLIRLNKYISNSGVCNRRQADKLILSGMIKVNGVKATQMGMKIRLDDIVEFNNKVISNQEKIYLLWNKPKKIAVDIKEIENYNFAPFEKQKETTILPIYKIDKNDSGVILFTNDKEIINKMSCNEKIKKIFHVNLNKKVNLMQINSLKKDISSTEKNIIVDDISHVNHGGEDEIGISLRSNNKYNLKDILRNLGFAVKYIDLVFYAGFTKKDVPRKQYRSLTDNEINLLKRL